MVWKDVIIKALNNLGGVATYKQLYAEIERIDEKKLSKDWTASVRAAIEKASSDSTVFAGKDDLFYSVSGLGKGIWGLRDFSNVKKPSESLEKMTERKNTSINRIIRDTKIIKELKALHNHECQLCDTRLEISKGVGYSEGHHVKPLGQTHNGPDIKKNVLILCPNCHALCDYGAIDLNKSKIKNIQLSPIDEEYIGYHNKYIFNQQE
jgi:Predicted restriction endonuclease